MKNQKTIHELVEIVLMKMRELKYSERTIQTYEKVLKSFKAFAEGKNIRFYTTKVGLEFLEQKCKFISNYPVKYTMEEKVRAVNRIDEYYKYEIISTKRPQRKIYIFPEEFKKQVNSYIVYRKAGGLSKVRIQTISSYLERFANYLCDIGIKKIEELDASHINGFIQFSTKYTASTVRDTFTCLRGFLSFIYEKSYTDKNLSFVVPSIRLAREQTIPSAYSRVEVEKILDCIDRSNIQEIRDYAMLILAARLGLRASDITNLTFSNLNWEKNLIEIVQEKTKKLLQLPLLNEVGDAIIDYLRLRPKVTNEHVFLRIENPPEKLHGHSLYEIVNKYIKRAKVYVPPGKKHGPHALRHSLSSMMLEANVPLPVISGILSHTSMEVTKVYLKIDVSHLRECALDVPAIAGEV